MDSRSTRARQARSGHQASPVERRLRRGSTNSLDLGRRHRRHDSGAAARAARLPPHARRAGGPAPLQRHARRRRGRGLRRRGAHGRPAPPARGGHAGEGDRVRRGRRAPAGRSQPARQRRALPGGAARRPCSDPVRSGQQRDRGDVRRLDRRDEAGRRGRGRRVRTGRSAAFRSRRRVRRSAFDGTPHRVRARGRVHRAPRHVRGHVRAGERGRERGRSADPQRAEPGRLDPSGHRAGNRGVHVPAYGPRRRFRRAGRGTQPRPPRGGARRRRLASAGVARSPRRDRGLLLRLGQSDPARLVVERASRTAGRRRVVRLLPGQRLEQRHHGRRCARRSAGSGAGRPRGGLRALRARASKDGPGEGARRGGRRALSHSGDRGRDRRPESARASDVRPSREARGSLPAAATIG